MLAARTVMRQERLSRLDRCHEAGEPRLDFKVAQKPRSLRDRSSRA